MNDEEKSFRLEITCLLSNYLLAIFLRSVILYDYAFVSFVPLWFNFDFR